MLWIGGNLESTWIKVNLNSRKQLLLINNNFLNLHIFCHLSMTEDNSLVGLCEHQSDHCS